MSGPKIRAIDESGVSIDDPSEIDLYNLIADLNLSCRFVIVDRPARGQTSDDYMQVWLNDDFSFQVEYREGGPDRHFEAWIPCPPEMAGHEHVVRLLLDWAYDRPGWRTALPWKPLAL